MKSKDVEMGKIGEYRVYLNWSDVIDICNKAVAEENQKLRSLLEECADWLSYIDRDNGIIKKIDEILGETK